MKPQKIPFLNQKGGVGKTTLTKEISIYLADKGLKVLLIDCDPQGNLTKSLVDEGQNGLYEAIDEGLINIQSVSSNLFLLAGSSLLSVLEKELLGVVGGYSKLKKLLKKDEFQSFDFILMDTPPSLGVLTINALTAASNLIIPMNASLYSMQGTNDLLETVESVIEDLNEDLNILGFIINSYDKKPIITREILAEIKTNYDDLLFDHMLSRSIKIEEAIAKKTGVIHLKNLDKSRVKEEISNIGEELLKRLGA